MSPVPIIERQRAISRIGEIRIGGEKGERAPGKKLESFRLTSQHRDVIERAASLYGGTPAAWESQTGPAWQLYTAKSALPVLVVVGYSLRQMYELYEGATCTRRCDGEEEQFTGKACLCNAAGKDVCDVITRLMLVLPETGTSLGWQLRSKGENAARELAGAMAIAEELARGRTFVPATLRLTQRRSNVAGQVVRYVVPVLDFDPTQAIGPVPVDGELPALPPGYTPIAPVADNGTTLSEGLHVAETQVRVKKPRVELPEDDDILEDEPGAPPPPVQAVTSQAPLMLDENKHALDALVGQLREAGSITTRQLWSALARMRKVKVDEMIDLLSGFGTDGELHWAPLRDSLDEKEAAEMRKRLGRLWAEQQEALPV